MLEKNKWRITSSLPESTIVADDVPLDNQSAIIIFVLVKQFVCQDVSVVQ